MTCIRPHVHMMRHTTFVSLQFSRKQIFWTSTFLFSPTDVLMFACVQREIGWRDRSRKMLLYSTDAGFHYAGDGKVSPNTAVLYFSDVFLDARPLRIGSVCLFVCPQNAYIKTQFFKK